MTQRITRNCFVFAAVLFCSSVSSAATFNYSLSCSPTTIGPVNIDIGGFGGGSGSVTLTPNVASTGLSIISTGFFNQANSNTVTSGTFTGTLSCLLTFGGVSVNFTRSLSLPITTNGGPANCTPSGFSGACLTVGAGSVTVNLGAQGTVVITSPVNIVDGYDTSEGAAEITVVPGAFLDTALLTPAAPAATPLPPSLLLMLTGLACIGLYTARRKLARSN